MSDVELNIPIGQIRMIPGGTSKHDALTMMIDAVSANPAVLDRDAFRRAVFEREAVMSTGIGNGVAVPHVRIAEVSVPTIGFGVAPDGIDFQALDNRPVYVVVLFATPLGAEKAYLSLMAKTMLILRNRNLFASLISCETPQQVHAVLNR